jgi:Flp pilus assembly protein TadD
MTDPLAEKIGINVQGGTVNVQNLNVGIAERLAQSGDRVRILVVAANPLGSSPLKLDHEVKTIQEALRRSRKRDNFEVEYRLAATPSELRRALLDLEPHVLHFSGHGSGEQGLLFVSDESASAIYRSEGGEVRSRSTNSNEIKFVPAKPLASLLQLCEDHLECVVLNACYSDVQGDAISANIPFTIGMRDVVEDNVAIKFSQGFYDAIGAGKGYGSAFEWGKAAISFDLANEESSNILILRKKGEMDRQIEQPTNKPPTIPQPNPSSPETPFVSATHSSSNGFWIGAITIGLISVFGSIIWQNVRNASQSLIISSPSPTSTLPSATPSATLTATSSPSPKESVPSKSADEFFRQGLLKEKQGDPEGALKNYAETIRLKPYFANAYIGRGSAKYNLGDKQGAIADYNEAIRLNPNFAESYHGRGNAKKDLGDKQGAIADYNESIRLGSKDVHIDYRSRGIAKSELGDYQGAIADYNEAIRLKPDYANAYNNRGNAKKNLGDKQGALADFRKASELYQQQGNTEWYNNSLARIKELGG